MDYWCLTVIIKSMCDLMSNNHSYPTKVKGLVLMFTEERRLQDSSRKHWTDINNRCENIIHTGNSSKQDYNEERLCYHK